MEVAAIAAAGLLVASLLSVTAGDHSMVTGKASGWAAAAAAARETVRARLARRQRFPDPPKLSSLSARNDNRNERPKIITKHHFMRERKSSLVPIPKPFVVSTELNVRLPIESGRRGRTWKQHDGSTVIEGKGRSVKRKYGIDATSANQLNKYEGFTGGWKDVHRIKLALQLDASQVY